jgi:2-polyprenyl-3-methyl-5-hydroxy-6-metoxy-1,4-benzoquinol methylase
MVTRDTDAAWKYYGKEDPYYGVLTADRYRRGKLDGTAKGEFLESGTRYVATVLETIHRHLDPSFQLRRGIDFGCGVGRLTIPFARMGGEVVGIDISTGMLEEAAKNCRELGVTNATFVQSDDELSAIQGHVNLVHSLIVFQHIPCDRGEAILARLLDLLEDDGVGVLQFTYAWGSTVPPGRQLLNRLYRSVPASYGVRNVAKGIPFRTPMMQMNTYDLNSVLRRLQEAGCHRVHLQFTETSQYNQPIYGVIIFFQKHPMDVRANA